MHIYGVQWVDGESHPSDRESHIDLGVAWHCPYFPKAADVLKVSPWDPAIESIRNRPRNLGKTKSSIQDRSKVSALGSDIDGLAIWSKNAMFVKGN